MPDLKPSRTYHEALRRLGIQNPGEVQVGVPVQLHAQVDDLGHLNPPVNVPVAAGGRYKGAVAGQFGVPIEFHILSPGGAWIIGASTFSGDCAVVTRATTFIDTNLAIAIPRLITGGMGQGTGPFRSQCRNGYNAAIAGTDIEGWQMNSGAIGVPPFWVEAGTFVAIVGGTANAAVGASMMIQEVP